MTSKRKREIRKISLTPARLSSLEPQSSQRGVAATKSEARNPKFETNQNDRNPNDLNKFKNETENLLNEISRKCTLVVQRKQKKLFWFLTTKGFYSAPSASLREIRF
jgi:hypothetical protein